MAANRFGIDVGQLYSTVENIKGARTRNKMAGMELATAERLEEERPAKEAAATERKNLVAQNIQGALGGDSVALDKLYALDIDTAKAIADRVDKMSEKEKEQAKANRLEMAQMSVWIADAKTPKEAASNFQVVLSKMPPETQEKMTAELESFGGDAKKYAMYSLARVKDVDTIFSNPKVVQVGGEDIVYKGGREIERAQRPVKAVAGEGGQGGLKSGDESLMYRQSAELLGGLFDQAGNITNLDPDVRNKVQGIATEATQIFQQGGVTRTQAVKMAAQKYGLNVSDPGAAENNDPLGLR